MKIIFWFSIAFIGYTYFIYPLAVYILSLLYKKAPIGKYIYPTVSVIIPAYNEAQYIEAKIKNLFELNYPQERIEVLVGSDGSTDTTDEIVSRFIGERLRFVKKGSRQGKPGMLNELVLQARGEIIAFTDARQRLDPNALNELVKHFSDPKVGSVSAELHFERGESKAGSGVGLYWRYEKFIRKAESRIGSMLGATGALYAIRKELFAKLPGDLILDDMYVPMCVVKKGYRAIFDKKAKIYDGYSKTAKEEFLRKVRTLAGNFQLFMYQKWLLNPFQSPVAWQLISHKFMRLLIPFFLAALLISNVFLLEINFYRVVLVLQILFYGLALFGRISKRRNKLCDVPYMFCVMNVAAIVGLYRFLTRKQDVLWEKAHAVS